MNRTAHFVFLVCVALPTATYAAVTPAVHKGAGTHSGLALPPGPCSVLAKAVQSLGVSGEDVVYQLHVTRVHRSRLATICPRAGTNIVAMWTMSQMQCFSPGDTLVLVGTAHPGPQGWQIVKVLHAPSCVMQLMQKLNLPASPQELDLNMRPYLNLPPADKSKSGSKKNGSGNSNSR